MASLASKISTLRKALGLSKAELARRAEVSPGFVGNLESGHEKTMSEDKAKLLAAALGVEAREIIDLLPANHPARLKAKLSAAEGYDIPKIGRTAASMAGIDPKTEPNDFLHVHTLYKGDVWAVEVSGTSMIDANICDGDHVIVRRQPGAVPGETVLAWVGDPDDGGFTLKKLARRTDRKTGRTSNALVPRNKDLGDEHIPLDGSVPVHVFGVYEGLIRKAEEERAVKRQPAKPKGKR